ncbi:AAA family ATPase [Chryseobacterium oncorhynchi]|uniref:AAA family ATPase n=1 Tax=Chryseobacterium oncorhynchi TaxID=741074 RepID=UPI0014037222|nr:ATP-binding protein [Chryseobacterium oncorhynchi]
MNKITAFMILDFSITNYKSFQDEATLTMTAETSKLKSSNIHRVANNMDELFRTSKVSVIYGPNASGKSNLLTALTDFINYIVKQPKLGSPVGIYNSFSFDLKKMAEPTRYRINFLGPENIRYQYSVAVAFSRIIEEDLIYYPEKRPRKIFKRKSNIQKVEEVNQGTEIEIEELTVDKKKYSVFSNQLLLSKFGEEPHDLLSKVYIYFRDTYNLEVCRENYSDTLRDKAAKILLSDNQLKKDLERLFIVADTKIFDLDIEEVEDKNTINYQGVTRAIRTKTEKKIQLHYGHALYNNGVRIKEAKVLVPHDNESKGTQTLFTIGTNILNALRKGQVLIVDELDSSLHPYITKMLVQLFLSEKINKNGAQLIFNTHDVTLLDEELFRKDQIWLTEKNDIGVSELFCLSDFDGLREDTPFEKWYMAGKFGGLPKIPNLDKIFS